MRRFAFVFWLLCFSLVRVYVCVWIHHLHTFVKVPIMMMICSLQWFYLDDLISLLSVGRRRRRRRKNLPFLLLTPSPCVSSTSPASSAAMMLQPSMRWQNSAVMTSRSDGVTQPLKLVSPPPPQTCTHACTQTHTHFPCFVEDSGFA